MKHAQLALILVFGMILSLSSVSVAQEGTNGGTNGGTSEPAPSEPVPAPAPIEPVSQPAPATEPLPAAEPKPAIQPVTPICREVPRPQCPIGEEAVPSIDGSSGCVTGYTCQAAGFTPDQGEFPVKPLTPPGKTCPASVTCSEGSSVACRLDSAGICGCDACPVSAERIPQGCRQELDPAGFTRVVCEGTQQCPQLPDIRDAKAMCEQKGGRFNEFFDSRGCRVHDCSFGQSFVATTPQVVPFATTENVLCPSQEEIRKMKIELFDSCKSLGQPLTFKAENGCRIPACGGGGEISQEGPRCSAVAESHRNPEARDQTAQACSSSGGRPFKNFDPQGCPFVDCAREHTDTPSQFCPQDVPPDSYDSCGMKGGELVIKRDQNGCVVFSQCVTKDGYKGSRYVKPIEEIPDETQLLQLAFKLESLKIQLNDLKNQALDIARYWKSHGEEGDANRFELVAAKFDAAQTRVDEAKSILREIVGREQINENDLLEAREEIGKVKGDLKGILYIMLSTDENLKAEIEDDRGGECKENTECFDEAWQFCKSGFTFEPEGSRGPIVTLKGTEEVASGDVRCVLEASITEGRDGPPPEMLRQLGLSYPLSMECKFPLAIDFAREGPSQEQLKTYCSGPMLELMEKFGGPGGNGGPGVPGKCSGDECRNYCPSSAEAAKECLEHLGPYLPPEAKSGLERIASGQGFGPVGPSPEDIQRFNRFERPGEFEGGFQQPGGEFGQPSFPQQRFPPPDQFGQGEFGQPQGFQQFPPPQGFQEPGFPQPGEFEEEFGGGFEEFR
ncbi:MAG: hypothetical protein HYW25_00320 [Candidatus Aenigmarchaeota archaeon]|nr:hypothetical protein [Candidatus Aenigmarchaeota archaeon]